MSKKIDETRKQGWLMLLALMSIAIAVYIGFTPLFDLIQGGIAGRVLGSSFGAIFVIILTMFLLNKQTEIEQESKKSERVFDEKVKIYQQILDITRDMLMDGKLTKEEINRLPFPVIRLQMLGGDVAIRSFQRVFEKLNDIYSSTEDAEVDIEDDDRTVIYQMLAEFASVCRVDLGISDLEIDPAIRQTTVDTISKSGKKTKDYSKFWAQLLPKINLSTSKLFQQNIPTNGHYIKARSGVSGLKFTLVVSKTWCRVELYIDRGDVERNEYIFNTLFSLKSQIENDFGGTLTWERLNGKRACRIKAEHEGNISNEEQWPMMIQIMTDSTVRLEAALKEPLTDINERLKTI